MLGALDIDVIAGLSVVDVMVDVSDYQKAPKPTVVNCSETTKVDGNAASSCMSGMVLPKIASQATHLSVYVSMAQKAFIALACFRFQSH